MRTPLLLTLTLALASAAVLTGCGSAEDRAAKYIERAQEFYDEEDFVKARLDLRTAVKIDRDNIEARLLLAEIAEKNRNYRAMYEQLVRVVAIEEDNVEARVKLGILQLGAAGQNPELIDQVREHVTIALAAAPGDPDARVLEASLKRYDGDLDGATSQVRALLGEHPDNVPAHSLLFSLLYQQGDVDGALAALDTGIELNQDSAALHLLRLQTLQNQGRWDDVEEGLNELIAQFPEQNAVRYQLANFYVTRDRLEDAQGVLEGIVEANPDDSTAKLAYAEFLANRRDRGLAQRKLEEYVAAEPQIPQYRFALAQLYQAIGEGEQAIATYQGVVDEFDDVEDRARARTELAKIFMREERLEEAGALVTSVLEESPSDPEALILRAGMSLQAGEVESAITDLRAARRNDPNSQRALALLAQAHLQSGDTVLAEERLRDWLAADPDNNLARDRLAGLLFSQGRFSETHTRIRDANDAGAAPTPASVRLLVESLIRDGRPSEALDVTRRELEIAGEGDVNRARLAHYLAGRAQVALQDYEGAITSYRAASAEAMTTDVLSGLITALVEAGRLEDALSETQEHLANYPDDFGALTLQGQVLSRMGQLEEARDALTRSLELKGDVWPTYRDLIAVNVALDDQDAALAVADRGLEVAPTNTQLRLVKAQLLERQERYLDAIGEYETLISTNPSSLVAVNNLASLIADHDGTPDRLAYALEISRPLRADTNPVFLDTVGWVNYRLGNASEAVPLLEQAVRLASDEPRFAAQLPLLRYHLGMTYVELDQLDRARQELQEAVAGEAVEFFGIEEARATLSRL